MDKTTIMNIEMLTQMLISLSADGIDFYGRKRHIPAGEICRRQFPSPFYEVQQHVHLEMIWRLDGEPAIHINGDWTTYRGRRAMVFVPGTWHTEHFLPEQPYDMLWLTVMPQSIMFHRTSYTPRRGYSTSQKRLSLNPPMARKLWEYSSMPALGEDPVEQAAFHYLLMEALYFCIRNDDVFPSDSMHFHQHIVEYLQQYLEDCYWEDITLDSLAASVHYSPGHLNAIFRHATGVPLLRYLSDIRMKKAKELLESKTMLVKQAAEAVGIHDQLYFSRKFRQHFGIPPQHLLK